jgi:type VI secretion system VasD/TssJ family lipoprotein
MVEERKTVLHLLSERRQPWICIFLAIAVASLIGGCGRKSTPTAPFGEPALSWTYEPDAVHLHVKADAELNSYNSRPHTLVMCVYELSDPNAFKDLAQNRDGIVKLLGCNRFDSSVVGANRVIVQPGEDKTVVLDRMEKAQYVGFVAGYYSLDPAQTAQLHPIPVSTTETGWMFKKKTTSKPGHFNLDLILGPAGILQAESK